jgi:hypothetical protein
MPDRRVLTRRGFVAGASALVAGARTWAATTAAGAAALTDLSAAEAVQRMRRGELSSEGYAEALLERCASAKALNAFITLEPDQVLRDARSADQLRAWGREARPAARPADSGQGQRQYARLPDERRHGGSAPIPSGRGRAAALPAACRRRHRPRKDQPARAVVRLEQQQSRVRGRAQSLRSQPGSRRQQRRHGGGRGGAHGAARYRGGHGGIDSCSSRGLRLGRIPAHDRGACRERHACRTRIRRSCGIGPGAARSRHCD